jgi:CRP-like cAMP-binding protein
MVECSRDGVELRRIHAGQYFGEMGVLGKESTETYTSVGASTVASIPADTMCQFEELLLQLHQEMERSGVMQKMGKRRLAVTSMKDVKRLKVTNTSRD